MWYWRAVFLYIGLYMYTNPWSIKFINLNNLDFHPLEVVSRYRDPQLQEGENYAYNLLNLRPKISKTWSLNTHSIPNNSDLMG